MEHAIHQRMPYDSNGGRLAAGFSCNRAAAELGHELKG
jgi:hypothetical protein